MFRSRRCLLRVLHMCSDLASRLFAVGSIAIFPCVDSLFVGAAFFLGRDSWTLGSCLLERSNALLIIIKLSLALNKIFLMLEYSSRILVRLRNVSYYKLHLKLSAITFSALYQRPLHAIKDLCDKLFLYKNLEKWHHNVRAAATKQHQLAFLGIHVFADRLRIRPLHNVALTQHGICHLQAQKVSPGTRNPSCKLSLKIFDRHLKGRLFKFQRNDDTLTIALETFGISGISMPSSMRIFHKLWVDMQRVLEPVLLADFAAGFHLTPWGPFVFCFKWLMRSRDPSHPRLRGIRRYFDSVVIANNLKMRDRSAA
ncbi:hypothetical protein KCU92_g296, partial [Aureobasidium melanogenum]